MLCKIFLLLIISAKLSGDLLIIGDHPDGKLGMFATANKIIGQLYLYEKRTPPELRGLKVDFDVLGPYYDPIYGKNWWNYYFEPIVLGSQEESETKLLSKAEGEYVCSIRRQIMTREEIISLVRKYVRPLPWIQEQASHFKKQCFDGFFIIGVHYRGTDKEKEAPRVYYEEVFEKIKEYIPSNLPHKIFVATDENNFLQSIHEQFPKQVIATDSQRSEGKVGVHFWRNRPFEVGKEAVIDALLLSYCDLLIRTSSNLSLWSTYFNPNLPVILLNHRFLKTLYPE